MPVTLLSHTEHYSLQSIATKPELALTEVLITALRSVAVATNIAD